MDIKLLQEIAYKKMGKIKAHIERERGHIYYHGLRTAKLALNIRKRLLPFDLQRDDMIYTGALFHDIGKGIEPHAETGYAIVKHLLLDYLNPEEMKVVSEIVRLHCERVFPNDYPHWVRIVQDADILDHMGTTEIWMNFLYSAHQEKSIDRSIEWYESLECKKNMNFLRSLLNYDLSKEIWDEKVSFVDSFIQRLKLESEGGILI